MYPDAWLGVYCLFETFQTAYDAIAHLNLHTALPPPPAAVEEMRDAMLTELRQLKDRLDDLLEPTDVGLVIFGLTVHLDERILTGLFAQRPQDWRLLQKQFLHIRNGGEDFFLKTDYILQTSSTSSFVWEIYYFCLKHGFRGRYYADDDKIDTYKKQLELRILSYGLSTREPNQTQP